MPILYTRCEDAGREHNWYRWSWFHERGRYERECSTMGCDAFEYLEGSLIASEPVVLTREGKEHVHGWGPWGPVEEFWVKDNRFYSRDCGTCEAREETGWVKELGKTIVFRRTG